MCGLCWTRDITECAIDVSGRDLRMPCRCQVQPAGLKTRPKCSQLTETREEEIHYLKDTLASSNDNFCFSIRGWLVPVLSTVGYWWGILLLAKKSQNLAKERTIYPSARDTAWVICAWCTQIVRSVSQPAPIWHPFSPMHKQQLALSTMDEYDTYLLNSLACKPTQRFGSELVWKTDSGGASNDIHGNTSRLQWKSSLLLTPVHSIVYVLMIAVRPRPRVLLFVLSVHMMTLARNIGGRTITAWANMKTGDWL